MRLRQSMGLQNANYLQSELPSPKAGASAPKAEGKTPPG